MNYLEQIEKRFGVIAREQRDNLHFVNVKKEALVHLLTWMRDLLGFGHLSFLNAIDYPEKNIIRLTYMLHSYDEKADVAVQVNLDRENPVMETIHHLWKAASTYQRELNEMFGVAFPGSPDNDVPFILEGWGDNPPPMRRDFDTKKYSEETFFPRPGRKTHDPTDYMADKMYPNDKGLRNE